MWVPDGRGGAIQIDHLAASLNGKIPTDPRRALWLVEQEEEARKIESKKAIGLWPSHGPSSIRILADYEEQLRERAVICVYQNDQTGRTWAYTAARILIHFAQVRLLPIYTPFEEWLRQSNGLHEFIQGTKMVTKEQLHYDPLAGGENPAVRIATMSGTRLFGDSIGIWDDMDSDELLNALAALECNLPIVYLEDETLPEEYRIRKVPQRRVNESFKLYEQRTGY